MKRIGLGLLGLLLVVAIVGYALRGPLTLRLMNRVVARNMATSLLDELPDGLHAALCGAGSPLPDPQRSGPCTAVMAGERVFVVDSGSGSSRILSRMRVPQGRIEAILLTHFHSDHIDGLGELLMQRWANGGAETPVPVHGPTGVLEVVEGLRRAYRQDDRYRVAHHGAETMPPGGAGGQARAFAVPPPGEGRVLLEDGGLVITAFAVDHTPVHPAVGYRFDYGGRSVLVSGDTKKDANLQRFAEGVDLLVHEALAPQLVAVLTEGARRADRRRLVKITEDILDYHTSPVEAAEIARDAKVGHLLYTHIVPPLLLPPMEDLFVQGVDQTWDGPVTVGRDGTLATLPVGSDVIEVDQLL
ncbi:MAG: MBL fold metallo-hydrolase [Myxococcota bacterium]